MIELIEARNYRSLRYLRLPLGGFQILVGPNGSGKTTLFDTLGFLRDLLRDGPHEAITARVNTIEELFHQKQGDAFELAIEMRIPQERAQLFAEPGKYRSVRYEVAIGLNRVTNEHEIRAEQVLLIPDSSPRFRRQRTLFPEPDLPPETISLPRRGGVHLTYRKNPGRNDNFYSELGRTRREGGWAPSFRLGPKKSGLANLPDDESQFPVTTWLRETLERGIQTIVLDSLALRKAAPPGQGLLFRPDGSNLPWVIHRLEADRHRHRQWIEILRTALPDIREITTEEFPDTRQRFLIVEFADGLRVPSWTLSDGTLRMLALTLPGYLPAFEGVYLIEEPENGIHPRAMETIYQALRQVDSAQILLATHSPVLVGCASLPEILCFKKHEGATDVVAGDEHPGLSIWKEDFSIPTLYASGVLG